MITRIIRPIQGRIEVRGLPKNRDPAVPNRQWFKDSLQKHIRPNWVSYSSGYGHWEIARSHLQPVVEAIVRKEEEIERKRQQQLKENEAYERGYPDRSK